MVQPAREPEFRSFIVVKRGVQLARYLAYLASCPIRRRLAAAGRPVSDHDRRLYELKDRHRGRRGFVIGAGPSLQTSDLDRLAGEVAFGSNKIYLAFDDTAWRPTYYSVVDVLVARNNREKILGQELTHIHGADVRPILGEDPRFLYLHHLLALRRFGARRPGFSRDMLSGVYGGHTVIYLQLQLALYMGIREVYLLGIDFSFDVPRESVTASKTNLGETVIRSRGEVNHFHPDYRQPGETWTMPVMDKQRWAFERAREAFEAAGGRLINASRRTKLDVLPREDLDRIL